MLNKTKEVTIMADEMKKNLENEELTLEQLKDHLEMESITDITERRFSLPPAENSKDLKVM